MIDPSTVNPFDLPFVPLANYSKLPSTPGIYFAIDALGVIQYIGESTNLSQRWRSHHRRKELKLIGSIRLAYLVVDDSEPLADLEFALRQRFNPLLNGRCNPVEVQHGIRCRLKDWLLEGSLNRSELARKTGVGTEALRRMMDNQFDRVDVKTWLAVCGFFGKPINELFYSIKEDSSSRAGSALEVEEDRK